MKSSKSDLMKRGFVDKKDIEKFIYNSDEELINLLDSKEAWIRTAAVYILSDRKLENDEFIEKLLLLLHKEKSLYTKIAICEALEKGNDEVAEKMILYLGKIGNNQYKALPEQPSKKKSYPLPRDIIARTLGNMKPEILDVLLKVLIFNDTVKISEAIDAIGFMVFYNSQLATKNNFMEIEKIMKKYKDNEVIIWKCITCLSAFPLKESISLLNNIKELINDTNNILYKEANRSINIINSILKIS